MHFVSQAFEDVIMMRTSLIRGEIHLGSDAWDLTTIDTNHCRLVAKFLVDNSLTSVVLFESLNPIYVDHTRRLLGASFFSADQWRICHPFDRQCNPSLCFWRSLRPVHYIDAA